MFVWERPGWPAFEWNDAALIAPLAAARLEQGRLLGRMQSLGFDLQLEAQLQALTQDVIKSSEIEGDILDHASVRSSLARRLGVPEAATTPADHRTEGVVEMMLDATRNFDQPLTAERLVGWQAALFPTGYSGLARVRTGGWRDDAAGFLAWYAAPTGTEGLLRAGLAHLWFVTIHPFDDGNGRIARAITNQALAQSEGSPHRFYSLSSQIRRERTDYYAILEHSQKGGLDVTDWLRWFLDCFTRAVEVAAAGGEGVLRKAEFWRSHETAALSERQRAILNRYLDGFEGHLTARKWAILGKCSAASAQRDIADLIEKGVLGRNPGGSKNTSYRLI